MPEQTPRLTPTEQVLEDALHALTPRESGLDRDALIFRMGQASLSHSRRRWRMASTAMLILAVSAWIVRVPTPNAIEHGRGAVLVQEDSTPAPLVDVPTPSDPSPSFRLAHGPAGTYIEVRDRVLVRGVDALPELPSPAGGDASSSDRMLDDLWPQDARPPSLWLLKQQSERNGDHS